METNQFIILAMATGASFVVATTLFAYLIWCSVRMRDSWLYNHFHPAPPVSSAQAMKAIPSITATASHSALGSSPSLALDGNPATRWTTGTAMKSGMWFQVDLGAVSVTRGILLDHFPSKDDCPESWSVDISVDGQEWQVVDLGSGLVDATWPETEARYVRATCIQPHSAWWWSVHEASVSYREKPPYVPPVSPSVPDPMALTEVEAARQVQEWAVDFDWAYGLANWQDDDKAHWEGWSCYRKIKGEPVGDVDLARIQAALRDLPDDKEERGIYLIGIMERMADYRKKLLGGG